MGNRLIILFMVLISGCGLTTKKGMNQNGDIQPTISVNHDTLGENSIDKGITAVQDSNKCNFNYLIEVRANIDNLSNELISKLLYTIDDDCQNNVEFGEFSNGLLFMVLEKSPELFIQTFENSIAFIDTSYLFFDLRNPISDLIDIKGIIDNINSLEIENQSKKMIVRNLRIAEQKY